MGARKPLWGNQCDIIDRFQAICHFQHAKVPPGFGAVLRPAVQNCERPERLRHMRFRQPPPQFFTFARLFFTRRLLRFSRPSAILFFRAAVSPSLLSAVASRAALAAARSSFLLAGKVLSSPFFRPSGGFSPFGAALPAAAPSAVLCPPASRRTQKKDASPRRRPLQSEYLRMDF